MNFFEKENIKYLGKPETNFVGEDIRETFEKDFFLLEVIDNADDDFKDEDEKYLVKKSEISRVTISKDTYKVYVEIKREIKNGVMHLIKTFDLNE
ncbi:MAG: hypothetical protein ACRCWM_04740 [Sarcina sp.]